MVTTLVELLPFIIGMAVVPVQIIILLLFLKNLKNGLQKGILFLTGITLTRLLQGVLFGLVLDLGASADSTSGKGPVVSTLLLVLGILLLISAYKKIKKEKDPEDETPKWMETVNTATNAKAFFVGIQLTLISPKMWVFILSAIGTISLAQLGQPQSIYTYIVFILLAQSLMLLTIGIRLLFPRRAVSLLAAASSWLEKNNRAIMIVISLLFGALFFYQGLTGLFF